MNHKKKKFRLLQLKRWRKIFSLLLFFFSSDTDTNIDVVSRFDFHFVIQYSLSGAGPPPSPQHPRGHQDLGVCSDWPLPPKVGKAVTVRHVSLFSCLFFSCLEEVQSGSLVVQQRERLEREDRIVIGQDKIPQTFTDKKNYLKFHFLSQSFSS